MQQILNILTPASSVALISLTEAKLALNISSTDLSKDAVLTMLIEQTSDVIAELANRVFVYEEVEETFYDISNNERRLYFSRWPVVLADIKSLTDGSGNNLLTPPTNWVLEQKTGFLYMVPNGSWTTNGTTGPNVWSGNIDCVYFGGYKNPDDVAPALKYCAIIVLRDAYYAMLRGAMLTGIRMIAHKQARVMYYPTGAFGAVGTGGAGGFPASVAVTRTVDAVLMKYIRHWL
jgi:hypothetical protein